MIEVGDKVQWISQGKYQFEFPKVVTNVYDEYVFVKGSKTGLPKNQVVVKEKWFTVSIKKLLNIK